MGAEKKYTPKTLKNAVARYFKSITREVTLKEKVPTGKKDRYGHEIFEEKPIVNRLGEEMTVIQFVLPPTASDLALFLGIHRSTWTDYCDQKKHPEFSDTTTHARGLMRAYLDRENLTRPGKDLKGVQFELQNNYGYSEKVTVGGSLEEFLSALEDTEGGAQEF